MFPVITQPWSVKVQPTPTRLFPGAGPVLFKCEVDLMGGGRDFIEVIGWKHDGRFIEKQLHRYYGKFITLFNFLVLKKQFKKYF